MNDAANAPDSPLPRILIVDDEEIVLVALYETLRRERYQVVTTSDPADALARAEANT